MAVSGFAGGVTVVEVTMTVPGAIMSWERAQDLRAALDAVKADADIGPHLDPTRVGVSGFSAGGFTSLVSVAQRGRTLGIHMILATQRPSGAVNDNIRTNTNLRVALRVQDGADSQDVIGRRDAADLSRHTPGRAYVRLGPGETRFVRVEIAPGAETSMHRTPQINDYLIALSGELTMRLEDGSSCRIKEGDMFVQLAGWHSWKNEGSEPFVMAGVVVGIRTDKIVPFGYETAKADA